MGMLWVPLIGVWGPTIESPYDIPHAACMDYYDYVLIEKWLIQGEKAG